MNENQELLTQFGVSTPELESLTTAYFVQALTAQNCLELAGDCTTALTPTEQAQVQEVVRKAGGTLIPVRTGSSGVRIED